MEATMYVKNGPLQLRKRTTRLERWSNCGRLALMRLLELPQPVRVAFLLIVLVCVTLLAGCATTSVPPTNMPRNPEPPPSALPASPPNYLEDARRDIEEWRRLLQELIQKPAN